MDSLDDSSLWIPEGQRHNYRAAKVLQCGTYTPTSKRPPMEFAAGDTVIVDRNYGAQEIEDDDGSKLLIVSGHDIAAVIG